MSSNKFEDKLKAFYDFIDKSVNREDAVRFKELIGLLRSALAKYCQKTYTEAELKEQLKWLESIMFGMLAKEELKAWKKLAKKIAEIFLSKTQVGKFFK
jgi:hypothetical protein